VIIVPGYIGLDGQSCGQAASRHTGCARDLLDQLPLLTDCIAFRPSRVVAMDGSIPPIARRPIDEWFRMSAIVRGTYGCRRWLSGASLPRGGNAHA